MTADGSIPRNPAWELFDLISPWEEVPANTTPFDARGEDYWPRHSQANHLLDEVEAYVSERAAMSNRGRTPGLKHIEGLRRGINAPGSGLLHTQSVRWLAIQDADLDWLEGIGQQWDRRKLAPNQKELAELIALAREATDLVSSLDHDIDSMHRDYMLEVSVALERAAREADIYGEPATARLAFELIGVLEGFLPKQDEERGKTLLTRLKRAASALMVGLTTDALIELTKSPVVIKAITDGVSS